MDRLLFEQMNKIYSENSWEEIPWNFKRLPETIRDYVESGRIKPCRALDVGCGVGNYSNWLSENGFIVTGIDLSPKAINLAKDKYQNKNLKFVCGDIFDKNILTNQKFDFIFDWQVLHHIFPENREEYAKRISKLLNKNGIYISVCFSEVSPQFGGEGKYRKTFFDTELYFSSEDEIKTLFEKYFNIIELKTLEIPGKKFSHKDIFVMMEGK